MDDEADVKKKIDEAMQTFQKELDELRAKLDAEVGQIIAEAKQQKIEQLKASLTQTNG